MANYRHGKRIALVAAAAMLLVQPVSKAEDFAIGTRVDASPYSAKWFPAKVTGTVQGGYTVKLDTGEDFVVPMNRIRAFTGTDSAASSAAAGTTSGVIPLTTPKTTVSPVYRPSQGATSPYKNATGSAPSSGAAPAKSTQQGQGKPPDGVYAVVLWTAGMMINVGKLEIRGNTYRGLNKDASFHPFSVDGSGNMALSSGLSGMPDGFTMKSVAYVGIGSSGRPLIHIKYIGRNNAHEKMDAIREN